MELADNLHLSRPYISEIEANKKIPTLEVLQNYADYFNIPLSTIMLFAEKYEERQGLKQKARNMLTKAALSFLDWICEEDEKRT